MSYIIIDGLLKSDRAASGPKTIKYYSKKLKEHVDIMIFIERYPLTPSRRVYYIFSGPPYGIIFSENSEKISLSMIPSFIDISRIKWLVFFIVVVFLPHPVEQTEFRRGIKDNGL